jgi:serine/threonine-protein kinase RsbW
MKNILSGFSHRGLNEQTNDETPSTASSTATEIKEVLPSQIRAISPFVDRLVLVLKPFIEKSKAVVGAEEDIETAVREALANAIIHGNRQDPHKSVYVNIICKDGEISITVRDEGQGFDASAVADPTALWTIVVITDRHPFALRNRAGPSIDGCGQFPRNGRNALFEGKPGHRSKVSLT